MADRRRWLVSADNHLIEPPDVYTSRVPKALCDRAPRHVFEDGKVLAVVDGEVRQAVEERAFGTEMLPQDHGDVAARLKVLEGDGVWAEGLLGNLTGVVVMCIEEPDFALACARAYNDWLAETFESYRDRVVGHAYIPPYVEPADAVAEIERAASLGLRSIILPLWPAEPYYLRKFDPLWEAAAAHNMPVCFHAHTGRWFRKAAWNDVTYPEIAHASLTEDRRDRDAIMASGGGVSFPQQGYQCFQVSGWFIGSGALERHPDLQLVFVECGAAWLLSAAEWLDDIWRSVPGADRVAGTRAEVMLAPEWRQPLAPSEYLRRQVHVTFQDEPTAVKFRDVIGVDALLWGMDFPHNEGTWPYTERVTSELFAGVPDDDVDAITRGNFAKLFGIPVPA